MDSTDEKNEESWYDCRSHVTNNRSNNYSSTRNLFSKSLTASAKRCTFLLSRWVWPSAFSVTFTKRDLTFSRAEEKEQSCKNRKIHLLVPYLTICGCNLNVFVLPVLGDLRGCLATNASIMSPCSSLDYQGGTVIDLLVLVVYSIVFLLVS